MVLAKIRNKGVMIGALSLLGIGVMVAVYLHGGEALRFTNPATRSRADKASEGHGSTSPERALIQSESATDSEPIINNVGYSAGRGSEIPLVRVDEPDICPTDLRIAYVAYRISYFQLRIMSADGTDQQVLREDTPLGHPTWSPDCAYIAFTSRKSGNDDDIWVLRLSDRALIRLTDHSAADVSPAWSPVGSRIAFVSDRLGKNDIWIMNTDGSGLTSLTQNVVGQANDPAWSPDSQQIVFSLCGFARGEALCNLATIRVVTKQLRIITTNTSTLDVMPHWSPAGIVFASDRGGGSDDIWIIQPDGSGLIQKTSNPDVYDAAPKWIPNRNQLIFARTVSEGENAMSAIMRLDLATGVMGKLIEPRIDIRGDLDGDGDVDQDDLNLLLARRNSPAGPNDPYDLNKDGVIDVLDARILTTLCTRPNCATQ